MSTLPLIALSGYARSGKDSVASTLVAEHGYQRVSLADPIRRILWDMNPLVYIPCEAPRSLNQLLDGPLDHGGWDRLKAGGTSARTLMVGLGAGVRDHAGPDVWLEAALRTVAAATRPVVVTDCRNPNEADAFAALGALVVRVNRTGYGPSTDPATAVPHPIDVALDGWAGWADPGTWTAQLHNDSTLERLAEKAAALAVVATGVYQQDLLAA